MPIKLVDETAVPPRRPPRRLSPADFKELQKQLEILLKANLIRPSNSPYGAPVLFVPKKGGKRRFAVDFRALNDRTIRDVTPLPRTDDLLQALNGARVFSKLDASWMFWQLHIKEEDTHKLGMVTPLGLFEWRVAPFGITNAPGHCMRVMNNVLRPFLHKFCQVMLDDIIVYSKTVEEHTEHLSQILAALDEARIFMKPSKCAFFLDSVVYLSHVVSANGIAPCRFILDAVEKFPEPKSVTEIRGFLGLCNYYRKLVRDFSEIARPLTDATKKGQAGFACLNERGTKTGLHPAQGDSGFGPSPSARGPRQNVRAPDRR